MLTKEQTDGMLPFVDGKADMASKTIKVLIASHDELLAAVEAGKAYCSALERSFLATDGASRYLIGKELDDLFDDWASIRL